MTKAEGRISNRELQRRFNVGWRTAALWRARGCPESDWAAIAAWVHEHVTQPQDTGPEFLGVLHPDDPRHRERLASSVIREIQIAVDKGERLFVEDVTARVAEELGTFKAALLVIPGRVALDLSGASPVKIESAVDAELQEALSALKADDPTTWPDAVMTPPGPLDEKLTLEVEEDFEAEYLPQLHPSDARYRHHTAHAELRARELQHLWSETIPLRIAVAGIKEEYETVRTHFATFPARVGLAIEDDDTPEIVRRRIQAETNAALHELQAM